MDRGDDASISRPDGGDVKRDLTPSDGKGPSDTLTGGRDSAGPDRADAATGDAGLGKDAGGDTRAEPSDGVNDRGRGEPRPEPGPEPRPEAAPEPRPEPSREPAPERAAEPRPELGPEPRPEPPPEPGRDGGIKDPFACPSFPVLSADTGSRTFAANTTGPACFVTCDDILGWTWGNNAGRQLRINGEIVSSDGTLPPKVGGQYYVFQMTAGADQSTWLAWWGTAVASCKLPDGGFVF